MTVVNENASFCADCQPQVRAYDQGRRDQWERDFVDVHGREPTLRERVAGGVGMGAMGPRGYPDCEKCHGQGCYMDDGSPAVLSRFIPPGPPPITEQAIDNCGAQSWARDDDGKLIVYGTCTLIESHEGRWHQEVRAGKVWAEWSGRRDDRAPAE